MTDLSQFGYVRVAAVSSEIRIADVEFNKNKILQAAGDLSDKGCSIICFQELTLTGYTSADLFFNQEILEKSQQALLEIKEYSKKIKSVLIIGLPLSIENKIFNAACIISQGNIFGFVLKSYLPNYSEFYEKRWFSEALKLNASEIKFDGNELPIGNDLIFSIKNDEVKFGVEICEDLWSPAPISNDLALNGADLIFNLSAGNEILGKWQYRRELVKNQSAKLISGYVYSGANASESSTDVTYSGHLMITENGKILKESREFSFETDYIFTEIDIQKLRIDRLKNKTFADTGAKRSRIIDLSITTNEINELSHKISKFPFVPENESEKSANCNEILNIQSTALARRLRHIGIKNVTIGISGGLDSTLALIVSVEAFEKLKLDKKGIYALVLPGPGSSNRTQENAKKLAEQFGVSLIVIDITKSVDLHLLDIDHLDHNYDITYENSQARERTQILMDYANKIGGITIGTGDLSELALGWCTYNADQVSMYGVNAGVPKTLVKYLIYHYANKTDKIEISELLRYIIKQPISPELIPANDEDEIIQLTEDRIGPYELNDFFLYYFLRFGFGMKKIFYLSNNAFEGKYSKKEIIHWLELFVKRFVSSQFKRSLMPDGIKVGSVALSPRADWRMPSDASSDLWRREIKEIKKEFKYGRI